MTPAQGDTDRRAAWVRARYQAGVADYLLAGDGFGTEARTFAIPAARPALARAWEDIFTELVAAGFMRRSRTGRYWWLATTGGGERDGRPD
jgi:hypothetical protein